MAAGAKADEELREKIRERLRALSEDDYKEFNDKLIPGVKNTLGVRVPEVRVFAKEIAGGGFLPGSFEACLEALSGADEKSMYYEEKLLQGVLIGAGRMELPQRLAHIANFVPRIDNWALCDSFCAGLKFIAKDKKSEDAFWEFLKPYLASDKEFYIRFGVIGLLAYYIKREYIHEVLHILDGIYSDKYYVRMGVAWNLSVCYVKFQEETLEYFKSPENKLDDFTYNKAIQKIRESFRVPREDKDLLNKMKRK